jgi:hypothetical protein
MEAGDKEPKQDEPESQWQYKSDDKGEPAPAVADAAAPPASAGQDVVEWTASEFVAHQKGFGWYMVLGLIGFVIAAGVYLVTHDIFSVVVVGTLAAVIGVAANQKPRVMTYRLDRSGLTIGQKLHPYGEFKSFSVVNEGAFASVTFLPLKRFMLSVSVYVAPDDQSRIIEALSRHLPMQPAGRDTFDHMLRRIRF